jgi:hypothetical protein
VIDILYLVYRIISLIASLDVTLFLDMYKDPT